MNNINDNLPEGISLEEEYGKTTITYEWYSNFYIPLFVFFLFWDGFLVYYFLQAIAHHEPNLLGSLLFGLPHILVGLFMTYYLIAIVVNQTIIELGNGELNLVHQPLPWSGNHQTVSLSELERIACERGRGSRHSPSTDIILYFKNGEHRTLISGIQNRKTAFFLRDRIWEFRLRSLRQDDSPVPHSVPLNSHIWDDDIQSQAPIRRSAYTLLVLLTILLVAGTLLLFFASSSQKTVPTESTPDSYQTIIVWDLQANDTVRYTFLDIYPEATSQHTAWFSVAPVWKDADIVSAVPIGGTLIEHRARDDSYRNQTYRAHSYLIESDQPTFGCAVTFAMLPHLHINSDVLRLMSIGLDPSDNSSQTRHVHVVILPDGVQDITVTDMQPYKTLTLQGRTLYYYDAKPITAHQSIHIAYTLTGIPTTEINLDAVIDNSKP